MYFDKPESRKNIILPLTQTQLTTSIPLSPKKYRDAKRAVVAIESILNSARVPRSKGDIDQFKPYEAKER
jgi:hypothetical protein